MNYRYPIGTPVKIVDTSFWGASTIDEMQQLVGQHAVIQGHEDADFGTMPGYLLDIDQGRYLWAEDDLEAQP